MNVDIAIQEIAPDAVYKTEGAGKSRTITSWQCTSCAIQPNEATLTAAYLIAVDKGAIADWNTFHQVMIEDDEYRGLINQVDNQALNRFFALITMSMSSHPDPKLIGELFISTIDEIYKTGLSFSNEWINKFYALIDSAKLPVFMRVRIQDIVTAPPPIALQSDAPITSVALDSPIPIAPPTSGNEFPIKATHGDMFFHTELNAPFWYHGDPVNHWLGDDQPFRFGYSRGLRSGYLEDVGDVRMASCRGLILSYDILIKRFIMHWSGTGVTGEIAIVSNGVTLTKFNAHQDVMIIHDKLNIVAPKLKAVAIKIIKTSSQIKNSGGMLEYCRIGQ